MNAENDKTILLDAMKAMEEDNSIQVLTMLLPLAQRNNAEAQGHVGTIYSGHLHRIQQIQIENTWDTLQEDDCEAWEQEDIPIAIEWLTKASEQGIGTASHNLAMLYMGKPKFMSPKEAIALARYFYAKAHAQGCTVVVIDDEIWKELEDNSGG